MELTSIGLEPFDSRKLIVLFIDLSIRGVADWTLLPGSHAKCLT